jgi:hypothetical protein
MKETSHAMRSAKSNRISLERRIILLVRRYRASEKRRAKKNAARLKRLGRCPYRSPFCPKTGVLGSIGSRLNLCPRFSSARAIRL